MTESLKILLVEDSDLDAELVLRELRRAGLRCESRRVQTEADFRRAMEEYRPHVILCDFGMPRFGGMKALGIYRELQADMPFIFVSGTIGEEVAIEALKAGASDYVLKTNLVRLGPTVQRELRDSGARRARLLAEAGLRRAQSMAGLAHVITAPDGSFESWAETLPRLIGLDAARMPASTREWLRLLHPDDRASFRGKSIEAGAKGARADVEYRLRRADGAWIRLRQVMEPLEGQRDADGRTRWFSTLQDVTEQKAAEEKIKHLNRVYAVLSGINTLIARVRSREELFPEVCRIAVESGEFRMAWVGIVDRETARIGVVASQGADGEYLRSMPLGLEHAGEGRMGLAGLAVRERKPMVVEDMARDARVLLQQESLRRDCRSLAVLPLLVAGEVAGVLALYAAEVGFFDEEEMRLLRELAGDISFALDYIGKAERLDYLAYYDSLTGLANRTLFHERLDQHLAEARLSGRALALLVMDLVRFKSVNGALGRQAGDELLRQIAARAEAGAGESGRLARIGGDVFAVVTHDAKSADDVARRVEHAMREIFDVPFRLGETDLKIDARFGIAMFPGDGNSADELFRNAEAALKKAKQGGERYLFFTPQMTARVAENLQLESRLRRALEREEFELHYQPKVDLQTRRIVGLEALIRWRSPDLGLVPPGRFIPLLEETGLILDVGAWALRRAALDRRYWAGQELAPPRVAVNVSAIQLRRRDFVEVVREALTQDATPPGIDLEITESLIMEDIAGITGKLKALGELGVRIAIDDFGTGYSSLGYLAKLPVHTLKIDRSFVAAMLTDPDTMTLVSTIISLAHSLRLVVVAEGVEAEDQARMLRLLRCDEMQGYLVRRPTPAAEITPVLRQEN